MSRQMALDCIGLITKKRDHKVTCEEYYAELMLLHKKYPIPGNNPRLTDHQYLYRRQIMIKEIHGFKYLDDRHPMNFEEAARMYIAHYRTTREPGEEG